MSDNIVNSHVKLTRAEHQQVGRIVRERVALGLRHTTALRRDARATVVADRLRPVEGKMEPRVACERGLMLCHGGELETT